MGYYGTKQVSAKGSWLGKLTLATSKSDNDLQNGQPHGLKVECIEQHGRSGCATGCKGSLRAPLHQPKIHVKPKLVTRALAWHLFIQTCAQSRTMPVLRHTHKARAGRLCAGCSFYPTRVSTIGGW